MIYLAFIVALALPSEPDAAGAEAFVGFYQYTDTANGDSAIEAAVDEATEELNFFIRPIARSKIKEKNVAPPSITILNNAGMLLVQTPFRAWKTDLKSTPLTVSFPGGRTGMVSKIMDGTDLVEVVSIAQTTRTHRYRLSSDGRQLSLQVSIITPKLSKPLVYQLLYKRDDK